MNNLTVRDLCGKAVRLTYNYGSRGVLRVSGSELTNGVPMLSGEAFGDRVSPLIWGAERGAFFLVRQPKLVAAHAIEPSDVAEVRVSVVESGVEGCLVTEIELDHGTGEFTVTGFAVSDAEAAMQLWCCGWLVQPDARLRPLMDELYAEGVPQFSEKKYMSDGAFTRIRQLG